MARAPRVYRADFDGVHEWIVAAPNQRAALDAFGVSQDLFAQGRAGVESDEEAVAAARAAPGRPLRRMKGSDDPFALPDGDGGGWAAALKAAPKGASRAAPKAAVTGKAKAGAAKAPKPAPPPRQDSPKSLPSPPAGASKRRAPARKKPDPPAPVRKAPDRRPLMQAQAALKSFGREEAKALRELEQARRDLERREAKVRADLEKRRAALEREVARARKLYEDAQDG